MNNSKINLVNKYKDFFYSKNLFRKLVFCLIAIFCFSSFGAVSAPKANASSYNVIVTKIGVNSVKINFQAPIDYDQKNILFTLNNSLENTAVYSSGFLYENIFEYTFNNVSAGNYVANVTSSYGPNSRVIAKSDSSVSIYINAVDKPQFNDIATQPADSQEQINWIASYGITTGYQDGGYHPNTKVSREQMASFIYRSASKPSVSGIKNPFVDLANNEHKNAVLWAVSRGIVQGYDCTAKGKPYKACTKKGAKVFYGSKFITRAQLALEIYRYFGSPDISYKINRYLDKITDSVKLASDEQKKAVAYLLKDSIVSGYSDGEYKPNNTVSRAQMAKFMAYSSQDLEVVPFLKIENFNPVNFLNTGVARNAITSIKFIDYLPECSSPIDVSYGDAGAILACVNGGEITIGQIGGVMPDSLDNQYLFSNFNSDPGVSLDLAHLNVNFAKELNYMFYHFGKINNLIYADSFGQNAENMTGMFENTIFPSGFVFPAKFGQNCTDTDGMFRVATLPADFSLPEFLLDQNNFKYSFSVDMEHMFDSAVFAPGFSLPDDFGMNAGDLSYIFANVNFPAGFHLPKNFAISSDNSGSDLSYAFSYSSIPASLIFPENFGLNSSMTYMFRGAVFPENYSFPANFAERAKAGYMFSEVMIPAGFTLPDDFCSYCKGEGMFSQAVIPADFRVPSFKLNLSVGDLEENMFERATIASGWTLPVGFFENAIVGSLIFNGAIFQGPFVLPNDFGINYHLYSIFVNVNLSYNIDWSAADLTNSNPSTLFTNTVWNNHVVLVKNQASKDALIAGGAPA
ncbi:MAG: S-layer homology domain-containing protein, partial [Bifidobacteriaceae bacterium]|nr:S-layer homology domain-containing protein [Bifidobacteriaceae bacterium]